MKRADSVARYAKPIPRFATLILLMALLPLLAFGQRKNKWGNTINVSTSFNYHSAIAPYYFFNDLGVEQLRSIELFFVTSNSGRFIIDEEVNLSVEREREISLPTPVISLGGSVQIVTGRQLFHEVSITKFSLSKSSDRSSVVYADTSGNTQRFALGSERRTAAFGLRYELGKYFGKRRRRAPNVRFGLSGGLESSYYSFKSTPFTSRDYPLRAKVFTLQVSVIPMLSIQATDKLFFELKLLPHLLLADAHSVEEDNPAIAPTERGAEPLYERPDFNLAASLLVRYQLKEPKRRRRK